MAFLRTILVCLLTSSFIGIALSWKYDRRPKIYGPRLSPRMLHPSYRRVQRQILYLHNAFRTQVKPPASDMLAMKWDAEASKAAQRLAQQCRQLEHERHWDKKLGFCGQNIFISTQQVPWSANIKSLCYFSKFSTVIWFLLMFVISLIIGSLTIFFNWMFAVRTWYLEKNKYKYGMRNNSLKETGHYLQMVWATSHKLGCGFATCPGSVRGAKYFSYVCNYCPTGNYLGKLGRPYKKGTPCSSCAHHCRKGKLCTNSCDGVDLWFNCREIHRTWPQWLCESDGAKGLQRKQNCAATCNCKGKIT